MTQAAEQQRFDELQEAILANAASVPDEQLIEFVHIGEGRYFPRMKRALPEDEQSKENET